MFAPTPLRRVVSGFLLLIFLGLWFANIESRKLIKPDEGRYAEISREMAASGDWLTPRLNAIKYFEKPPLQYWATAAAFSVFGVHHWTARLWSALTGLLGILLIGYTGRRLFGAPAGVYGAMVAASSLFYVALAHITTLDMGLTFFMTGALCAFLLGQQADASVSQRRRWMALAWAATAAAILSKGLVALVIPGFAIFLYVLVQRDWRILSRLEPLLALGLLAVIAAPWFVLVSMANPEFPEFFFIHEHFTRFLTTEHRRGEPWWYFVPMLLLGLIPWTLTAVAALQHAWRADAATTGFANHRFLVIWSAAILLFFSLSGSKLPAYILPMFPAMALFIGHYLALATPCAMAWQMVPIAMSGVGLALAAPLVIASRHNGAPAEYYDQFAQWIQVAGGIGTASTIAAIVLALRNLRAAAVATAALGGLLCTQIVVTGHDSLNPISSAHGLVNQLEPLPGPEVPFYSVLTYDQTLPFYLGRPVTLVAFRDEMDFGLRQEPALAIESLAEFEKRWINDGQAFAALSWEGYRLLDSHRLPMQMLASDPRRVVVGKP